MSEAEFALVAFDTGDYVALSAVGHELETRGMEVFWEPNDPLTSPVTAVYGGHPAFKLFVRETDYRRARDILGDVAPAGVRFTWEVEEESGERRDLDDDAWDASGSEVDDPAALAAAEAAVRGGARPASLGTGAAHERFPSSADAGWHALVEWPKSETVRHRSVAFLGLGSNLGDRIATIASAVRALDELDATDVIGVSHIYESEPWGPRDQPAYANAVVAVATAMRADQLLLGTSEIEESLGRDRSGQRYGPRSIDIDILLFGDEEWRAPDLIVPHPRMLEREFVVCPLLEIDPDVELPDGTRPALKKATAGRIIGLLGTVPGYERLTPRLAEERPEPLEFVSEEVPTAVSGERQETTGWVVLEEALQGLMMSHDAAMTLQVHLGILEDAGIPAALDPPPLFASPGAPYPAAMMPIRLMVPFEYEEKARRALRDAQSRAQELEGFTDGA
ncbi:MAG: 2-amino-4-hydroxy-6-hydroxymethyldihydropteridine diphosphokinase [Coriobacteriales bacterium]|nr:2-amino-4-hydroxy-6-hydroxymethyldihydropteridine diphosphokinase [Actinomycetes bacterium]